ncbi:MAG: lysoplasmalogenase [Actinomycetes bacterium]
MNLVSSVLLGVTLILAMIDWWAVGTDRKHVEYFAKPFTMVALIGVAASLTTTDESMRVAFVIALLFSLLGDVFLMVPEQKWPATNLFVFGLASFLLGHLAYISGLVLSGVTASALVVGAVLVLATMATIGRRIFAAVRASDEPALAVPVAAYIAVISVMVICAFGTLNPFAIFGAVLFYTSDALIAWNRFNHRYFWGGVAITVTYHLGQIGLILALI